jgi:N-acetyl-anhydromuramoyl-L-alanine amidase
LDRVTDHRQVAPGRKRDLNPVEWDRLLAAIAGEFGRGTG